MEAYRKAVDEHPEVLEKLVKRFNKQAQFTLSGPEYARKKTAPSPLLAAWYNKKSINLQHDAAPDERMLSPELAQDIIEGFRTLMPRVKYPIMNEGVIPQRRFWRGVAHRHPGAAAPDVS